MHRICQLQYKRVPIYTKRLINASTKQHVRNTSTHPPRNNHQHNRHLKISDTFRLTMSRLASPAMVLTSAVPMSKTTASSSTTTNNNSITETGSTSPAPSNQSSHHIDPKQDLHGMTLSSVCSLSVYPTPYLEFNLHLPSYTSTALHNHKYLAIHLMPPTHQSAKTCRVFAKGVKLNKRGTKWTSSEPDAKAVVANDSDGDIKNDKNGIVDSCENYDDDDDGEFFHEMTTPFTDLVEGRDYTFIKREQDGIAIPVLTHAEVIFTCKATHNFTIDDHEIWVAQVIDIINSSTGKTGGILYFNKGFHKVGESISEE